MIFMNKIVYEYVLFTTVYPAPSTVPTSQPPKY